jgi:cytochrome P450
MASPAVSDTIGRALTSDGFYADPYPTYRLLREERPVYWCEPWGQWLVTRYEDVLAITKDARRFSSSGWERRFMSELPAELRDLPHMKRHYGTRVVSMTDPPEHTRLRRLVSRSLTPRVLDALRPAIESIVGELLDAVGGRSSFDAIGEFAYPLPAIVIARLLGAPDDARGDFMRWSKDIVDFVGTGQPDPSRARRTERTLQEFRRFLEPVILDRRSRPREDLMSLLASPAEDGDRLTDDEVVSTCIVLLFAGHETTANLLGNGLLALLRNPSQLLLLRERPELTAAAVEELLRYDSPVQRNRRLATTDVTLHGETIRAGDPVMVFLGAANRDPSVFDEPDLLDLERSPNHHLAFGHGIHFCVGAALSRLEAPIALRALLDRYPRLRLDGEEASWRHNITFRGLSSLILRTD